CSGSSTFGSGYSTSRPGAGPGFWTGLGTGGLLGYLFGNRGGNSYYGRQYYDSPGPSHYRSSWASGSSFGGGASTGSRTTSGYGGTRRR
uniref:Store-operated calcium entry-associated regulatory factor n=1 Tax=Romanomermis culicivorax TaxID=13658 RepID=A0A915L355_ROMCU